MTTKTHDLVAKVGEKPDGKARWRNVGAMFKNDEGHLRIKLDSIPIAPGWDGWLAAFDADRDKQPAPPRQETKPAETAPGGGFDDDIPFAPRGWWE